MTFVKFNGSRFKPDPKPEKQEKKKKKRISHESKKRAAENKLYSERAPIWLIGKICPITNEIATQVHHKKGRIGKLLLDERYWLGVSAEGHDRIERNPEWAYSLGYSLLRSAK